MNDKNNTHDNDPADKQSLKSAPPLVLLEDWRYGLLPSILGGAAVGLYISMGMGIAGAGCAIFTMAWIKDLETVSQRWRQSLVISALLMLLVIIRILAPPVYYNSEQMIGQAIAFGIAGIFAFSLYVLAAFLIRRMQPKTPDK